jgi:hypothetical protein
VAVNDRIEELEENVFDEDVSTKIMSLFQNLAEGRVDRRDDLRNQSVQVCKARLCGVKGILADIVKSFIVDLNSHHQRRDHRHRKATNRYAP